MRRWRITAAALLLTGSAFLGWKLLHRVPVTQASETPPPRQDVIPPGIIVTESSLPSIPSPATAPGDRLLEGYGTVRSTPEQDLTLLARTISNFLLIDKQATARPLSANEEWSAALRGLRPGSGPWISGASPVFDERQRLIDRWQTPLHFHALGRQQWEIRSAGPDRKLWTGDDLVQMTSG